MDAAPPSLLTRAKQWILYGGAPRHSTREQQDQVFQINMYSLLGWPALTIFGLLHIFVEQSVLIGQLELILGGVILLNAVGLRLSHNIVLARTFFLLTILIVLMMLLVTGGTKGTGAYWLFVYPLLVFFLAGRRQGAWWMGLMLLLIGVVMGLNNFSLIDVPYSFITLRQLLASLLMVSAGVYIYEGARERALTELHDNRRDLQEHLDHMTTFSLKVSLGGTILLANKAAKDASGQGDNLVGVNFAECTLWSFEKSVSRRVQAAFYKALSGQTVNYDEKFKIVGPHGQRILTVNFSLIPILKRTGRIKYILAEAQDITAEQEIDRAKSEFVALASERLGDPLLNISSTADRLINGTHLQPDQLKGMQRIYKNSQYMAALIDDMLLVAKLELGTLPLSPSSNSPIKLTEDVIKEIEATQLSARKLNITTEYQSNPPDMPLDSFVFQTILNNLITNAVTYTPDDGHVYVRINQIEEKLYPESKGSLQIVVQDNGKGIAEADQTKLFTKFFSSSSHTKQQEASGTGLGLYIVKSMVDYAGGIIAFRSEEGIGSTFIVTLPLEGMIAKR